MSTSGSVETPAGADSDLVDRLLERKEDFLRALLGGYPNLQALLLVGASEERKFYVVLPDDYFERFYADRPEVARRAVQQFLSELGLKSCEDRIIEVHSVAFVKETLNDIDGYEILYQKHHK
ncbi:hypothetical protein J4457_06930 [Candidatus Woesearchaeota archaeon]|nr:hypothetical protein [Candidatus Woesearchaeota archaeon]